MNQQNFQTHDWRRSQWNPILPPGDDWFDVSCCMNPFVVKHDDDYWMYYAGGDADGRKRICLAIAHKDNLTNWQRRGPLFEPGGKDTFDERWCVLPTVHKFGDTWHLYYTGRSAKQGAGLQSFWGMGLAQSKDGQHWERYSDEPLLSGTFFPQFPQNKAIAGGGPIIEIPQPDGRILYRMYYTLPTGTPSDDILVDQAKRAVVSHSYDGIEWFDHRIILEPRLDADYENAACIALNPWHTGERWRAVYAGIGTRFWYYSICEAVSSDDGLTWHRGEPNQNLALPPGTAEWENQMTEYPNIVREGNRLRMFYCGNGYGRTGIGLAEADMLP